MRSSVTGMFKYVEVTNRMNISHVSWYALSSFLLLLAPQPLFLQLFVVTYGFAVAARDVIYPLIVAHCFGVRYLAQIYGALMIVLAPSGSLGSIFPALIHDRFGSYDIAFASYAALNSIVFLLLVLVRSEQELSAARSE